MNIEMKRMEENQIKNWDKVKERLEKEHPQLTREDLIYEIGKEEELLRRLQQKLKKNEKEIRSWLSLMG
jgi:hypothetical protein